MSSSAADMDNKEKDKTIKVTSKDDKDKSTVLELLEEDDEFEVLLLKVFIISYVM